MHAAFVNWLQRCQRVEKLSSFLENCSVQTTWSKYLDRSLAKFVGVYFQVGAYSPLVSSDSFQRDLYLLSKGLPLAGF